MHIVLIENISAHGFYGHRKKFIGGNNGTAVSKKIELK